MSERRRRRGRISWRRRCIAQFAGYYLRKRYQLNRRRPRLWRCGGAKRLFRSRLQGQWSDVSRHLRLDDRSQLPFRHRIHAVLHRRAARERIEAGEARLRVARRADAAGAPRMGVPGMVHGGARRRHEILQRRLLARANTQRVRSYRRPHAVRLVGACRSFSGRYDKRQRRRSRRRRVAGWRRLAL